MILSMQEKKYGFFLFLLGFLLVLPGCFNQKEKELMVDDQIHISNDKGDVLLSIDGKPVLYVQEFEDQKAMAQQSNQQLNMILQMMPEAEYTMLFKSIEAGHLMKAWVVREGIDQRADLVKKRQQYHDAIDAQLYIQYYEEAHPVDVTEHEALAYYKAKRDQIPGLMLAPSGVELVYVSFETKPQAEAFLAKIKDGSEKHCKAAAKEADLKLETIAVNQDSQVSDVVKNIALSVTKFPTKELVKVDEHAYWVIGFVKKQEAQYRSFDEKQIKDGITKMCKDEKREAELTKQIEKLRKEFKVEENNAYFEKKQQNQAKALQQAELLVRQAQQNSASQEGLECDEDDAVLQDKI